MIYEATSFECSRIAQDLQIRKLQVESVVQLFNEGNTVPFLARYRKEKTGGLDEDAIRQIQTRLNVGKQLHDRKQTILKSIESHGKLSDDLRREIENAASMRRLDDLYLPFKPRKKSLAKAAADKGLEPLALAIWHSDAAVGNLEELWPSLVNPEKQLNTVEDVKAGVQHLITEMINETAEVRALVRRVLWKAASVVSVRNEKMPEGHGHEYKPFFQFKEPAQEIRPHRILALNRGEKDGALKVKLEVPADAVQQAAGAALAEHLLKIAGTPTPQAPPAAPPEPVSEAPPAESASVPPVETPAAEATPPTAPLVESLPTEPKPPLTGEPLAEGIDFRSPHTAFLKACIDDALSRLLLPSLEREVRIELTDEAELHAAKVFAHNIRSLLMQPPLVGRRVLAIAPGHRNGCKLAALDEAGKLLEHAIIYPHGGGPGGIRKAKEKKPKEPPLAAASAEQVTPAPVATGGAAAPLVETPAPAEVAATTPTPEVGPAVEPAVTEAPPVPETPPAPEPAPAPEPTVDKRAEGKTKLEELIKKHNLNVIALGNGPACRETEELIAEVIASVGVADLAYAILSEVGLSAYSNSPLAKEEFADLDLAGRAAVSIGRRLQDPLGELVKIDPPSLGSGLHPHDVGRKELKDALEAVVESCVNQVGADVNTASVAVLRHISGLNPLAAREIVEYRQAHGPFTSREQLTAVPSMNPTRFAQAAGFLKVPGSANPLDRVWVHPESYGVVEKLMAELGFPLSVLDDKAAHAAFRAKLNDVDVEALAKKLEIGVPTLDGIFHALAKPGKDPRDDATPPIFKRGILKLEDLQAGQELKGTVLNVVDFGAFVDVGLKDSGLVHISQMANKYIKSPYDVVSVNDIVTVWVLKIDKDSSHVSLTMIRPGSERKPGEREQRPPRREGEGQERDHRGPPRGQRPPMREGQGQRRDGGRPPQRDRRPPPREQTPLPPPPPLPPRKPRREAPMPKLSQAAKEGKAPLRTLGELAAFFAAKEQKETPPPPPVVEKKEEPAPEPKPPEAPPS